jgi:hypothetical protein
MRYGLLVMTSALALAIVSGYAEADRGERNFAGSIQLDYLAVPTSANPRQLTLDAATFEASMKVTMDFSNKVSGAVKICIACHGFEAGMAFFDLRVADELNFRVGRLSPSFGSFPLRHDPANHRTSDKPLPYDMGRMLRFREWNEGVLPAPWVDNGLEINGTHFFDHGQIDFAAYLVSGPKGGSDGADFDFTQSRSADRYYVDNNSEPSGGARIGMTFSGEHTSIAIGGSAMGGHYDPDRQLSFLIAGADVVLQSGALVLRGEYLFRRTEMAIGATPETRFKYGPNAAGKYANYFVKDGFYVETEIPVGSVDLLARWDGLRRRGNVLAQSLLRSDSALYRYTVGAAMRLPSGVRLKVSVEAYDFSDFSDELAMHLGISGAL